MTISISNMFPLKAMVTSKNSTEFIIFFTLRESRADLISFVAKGLR